MHMINYLLTENIFRNQKNHELSVEAAIRCPMNMNDLNCPVRDELPEKQKKTIKKDKAF